MISHTNHTFASCTANRCSPVPVVQHAVPDSYLAVQGSVAHYTCIDGFVSSTSSPVSTACDGVNWAPTGLPGCQSKCKTSGVSYLVHVSKSSSLPIISY